MPSERKIVSFRPDATEEVLLEKLSKKRGLSASRLLGTVLREAAAREGITVTEEDLKKD